MEGVVARSIRRPTIGIELKSNRRRCARELTQNHSYENQVTIPADYFYKMSLMDYNAPHEALIREFFQNSVDAGCKTFIVFFDDENQEITFTDDGCGMDEEVIINRLLVMGGSFKTNPDAIGDFGHAKILIYFSWREYEIITNSLRVRGKSNRYSIEPLHPAEQIKGTASKIQIEKVEDYTKIQASVNGFFAACGTDVRVIAAHLKTDGTINTEDVNQGLKPILQIPLSKEAFQTFIGEQWNEDHYGNNYVFVRSNGVLMFRRYCSSLKKPMIVETRLKASTLFTQNRDSFKREYQEQFSDLLSRLNNDNVSSISTEFHTFIAETKHAPREKSHKHKGEIEILPSFYTLGKTKKSAERYFLKKRATRMKLFVERLVAILKERSGAQAEIDCGFVFRGSVEGLVSHGYGGGHILYVNPMKIEEMVQDKHKMAYKVWDMVIHEFAHIWCYIEEGNQYHNESYVLKTHEARDLLWDQREVQAIFSECWKAVK